MPLANKFKSLQRLPGYALQATPWQSSLLDSPRQMACQGEVQPTQGLAERRLVEVAGIEPASENLSHQASTCVVRDLINPEELPRTGYLTGESA